ncbi:MAG: hypothetical protein IJH64_11585 [Oscillospiraceae bacterium]|nr:hypothetical protein [Oscillospiraceae bacterium]
MKKKLLTILLAMAMLLLLLPLAVFAEGEEPAEPVDSTEPTVTTGWNADRTQYYLDDGTLATGLFKAKMTDGVGALFYADENGNVVKEEGLITVKYPQTRYLRTADSEGHVGFRAVGDTNKEDYTYLIGEEGAIVETAKIYKTAEGKVVVQDNGTVMKKSGFIDVGTKRYYVKKSGYIRTKSGWMRRNGDLYRFGNGGVVRTKVGQFRIGSDRYVIPKSDGIVATKKGTVKANGKIYFVRSKYGKLGSNKTYKFNGRLYHVNKYGVCRTGKHKWKDGKYYFGTKWGYLKTKTGMVKRNGYRFLVKKGGLVVVSTKFKYKNHYYIANKYGSIKTGMFKWHKTLYYANENGVLKSKSGMIKYNGDDYFVFAGGEVAVNKMISWKGNRYVADENGRFKTGLFKWKGTLYYANDDGVLKSSAGMIEHDGHDYFVFAGGEVAVNKMFYWKGKLYCTDGKGYLLSGLFKRGNTYYFADSDHTIRTSEDIFKHNGNYYYNKKGGGLAKNEWVEYDGKHYYAGDNAAFKTSSFTIDGVTFHPKSNGTISDEEYKLLFPDPEPEEEEGDVVEDVD